MLEAIATTRAIRRYAPEPVPDDMLREILFAATRAPSGSNRQAFRFLVLTDGPHARRAKELIGRGAREVWQTKRARDRFDEGSGVDPQSPKARLARTMQGYVDDFESVPVLILAGLERYREPSPMEGASVYPACQNLLLAARALGYGGVLTGWHHVAEPELRELLAIPEHVFLAATITLGKPVGHHGPVRRRPVGEIVFAESWGEAAPWAVDAPGTRHAQAGPPT